MKAIVKTERKKGAVAVLDVPDPEIQKDDEVIIKVHSAAVCGSDVHAYEYTPDYHWMKVPTILGHEMCGEIIEAGSSSGFAVGQRVMVESNKTCGKCKNCMTGRPHICNNNEMRGLAIDGLMSEYAVVESKYLHHVPANLTSDEAASAQAATVSAHAVLDRSRMQPLDNIVVMGPGIIGLTAGQIARIKGADKIIVAGTNADEVMRLPIAKEFGFITINVQQENLNNRVREITGVDEVDMVIECSGAPAAIHSAFDLLKKGGELLIVSIPPRVEIPFATAVRRELNLITSYTSGWKNYEDTLKLLSKRMLNIQPMIASYSMDNGPQAIADAFAQKVMKPVINP